MQKWMDGKTYNLRAVEDYSQTIYNADATQLDFANIEEFEDKFLSFLEPLDIEDPGFLS